MKGEQNGGASLMRVCVLVSTELAFLLEQIDRGACEIFDLVAHDYGDLEVRSELILSRA